MTLGFQSTKGCLEDVQMHGCKTREQWEKIYNVQLYHTISQKRYKLVLKLLYSVNMKSYVIYPLVVMSNDHEWPFKPSL